MENTGKLNPQETKTRDLLDKFLKVRTGENSAITNQQHLDQDDISAFIEGNIVEREAKSIVLHLIDCSFCRNITSELIRLDLAFSNEAEPVMVTENQPTTIAEVLSGILTRIFGSNEGAVFAHNEAEKNKEVESENDKQD